MSEKKADVILDNETLILEGEQVRVNAKEFRARAISGGRFKGNSISFQDYPGGPSYVEGQPTFREGFITRDIYFELSPYIHHFLKSKGSWMYPFPIKRWNLGPKGGAYETVIHVSSLLGMLNTVITSLEQCNTKIKNLGKST